MVHMVDDSTGEIVADVDLDILTRPFPQSALKKRPGGGTAFTYVDGTTVIHRLIEATHNQYSFSVEKYWTQDNTRLALVTLTITGLGSRSHIGVQAEQKGQGEDALAKGAITDGLKKAATLFGVGLELYGPDLNAGETQTQATQATQATSAPRASAPASTPAPNRPTRGKPAKAMPTEYPKVPGVSNTVDLIAYMQENSIQVGGNGFGDAVKAARKYGQEVHGIKDIIIGTGDYDEKYQMNKCFPSDVANALGYWFQQEGDNPPQTAKATAAPQAQEDDDFDSVPF